MRMNGTLGFWDRVALLVEEGLAWFVESGAIGALIVLWILAALFGIGR